MLQIYTHTFIHTYIHIYIYIYIMIVKFYFLWTFWQLFRTLHLASFPIEVTWIPENVPNDNSAEDRVSYCWT